MDIHFYHGWACDSTIWKQVIDRLPKECRVFNHDRGYFKPELPGQSYTEKGLHTEIEACVIVTHSMGLLTVPDHILSKAFRLVVVNGFVSFCSKEPIFRKKMESVLTAMILRTKRNPALQIAEFRRNAGFENDVHPGYYNIMQLVTDLGILGQNHIKIDDIKRIKDVVFITDSDDPIVSPVLRGELKEVFCNRASKNVIGTKHLAPLRVPDLVVQCILSE